MSGSQVLASASAGGRGAAAAGSQPSNQTAPASDRNEGRPGADAAPDPSSQGGDDPARGPAVESSAREQHAGSAAGGKGDAIRPAASTQGEEPPHGAQRAPTRPKQGRGARSHDMNPVTRRRLAAAYGMPVPGAPPSLPRDAADAAGIRAGDGRGRRKEPRGRSSGPAPGRAGGVKMPPVRGASGPSDASQHGTSDRKPPPDTTGTRTAEHRQKRKAEARQSQLPHHRGRAPAPAPPIMDSAGHSRRGNERLEAEDERSEEEGPREGRQASGRQRQREAPRQASGHSARSGNGSQPESPRPQPGHSGIRAAPSRVSAGSVPRGRGTSKSGRPGPPHHGEGFSREAEALLRSIERAKQDLVTTEEKVQRARAHYQELMRQRVHEASRSAEASGRSATRASQSAREPAAGNSTGRHRATARRPATQASSARKGRALELVTEPTPYEDIERLMVAAEGREGRVMVRDPPKRPATPANEGPVSPRLLQRLEAETHRRAQELSVAQDRVQEVRQEVNDARMTTMKRQRVLEVLKSRREKAEAAADAVIKEVEALRASARDTKQELKDLERVDEEEAEAATDEVARLENQAQALERSQTRAHGRESRRAYGRATGAGTTSGSALAQAGPSTASVRLGGKASQEVLGFKRVGGGGIVAVKPDLPYRMETMQAVGEEEGEGEREDAEWRSEATRDGAARHGEASASGSLPAAGLGSDQGGAPPSGTQPRPMGSFFVSARRAALQGEEEATEAQRLRAAAKRKKERRRQQRERSGTERREFVVPLEARSETPASIGLVASATEEDPSRPMSASSVIASRLLEHGSAEAAETPASSSRAGMGAEAEAMEGVHRHMTAIEEEEGEGETPGSERAASGPASPRGGAGADEGGAVPQQQPQQQQQSPQQPPSRRANIDDEIMIALGLREAPSSPGSDDAEGSTRAPPRAASGGATRNAVVSPPREDPAARRPHSADVCITASWHGPSHGGGPASARAGAFGRVRSRSASRERVSRRAKTADATAGRRGSGGVGRNNESRAHGSTTGAYAAGHAPGQHLQVDPQDAVPEVTQQGSMSMEEEAALKSGLAKCLWRIAYQKYKLVREKVTIRRARETWSKISSETGEESATKFIETFVAAERRNLELVEQLSALGSEQSKQEASLKSLQAALAEARSRGQASSLARDAFVGKLQERRERLEKECKKHQRAADRVNKLLGQVAEPSFQVFRALLAAEPSPDAQVQSILASGPSVMTLPLVMGHVEERVVSAVHRLRQAQPRLLEGLDADASAAAGVDSAAETRGQGVAEARQRESARALAHSTHSAGAGGRGSRGGAAHGPSLRRILPPATADLAPESDGDTEGGTGGEEPASGGDGGTGAEEGEEAGAPHPSVRVDRYEDLWGHAQEYARIHADVAVSLRQRAQDARARLAARKRRAAEPAPEEGGGLTGADARQPSAGTQVLDSDRTPSQAGERGTPQAQRQPTSATAPDEESARVQPVPSLRLSQAAAAATMAEGEGDTASDKEIEEERAASKQRARDYQRRVAARSARTSSAQQSQSGPSPDASPRVAPRSQPQSQPKSGGSPKSNARPQSVGTAPSDLSTTMSSGEGGPHHPLFQRFSELGLEAAVAGAPLSHSPTSSPRARSSFTAGESVEEELHESEEQVPRDGPKNVVEYGRAQDHS